MQQCPEEDLIEVILPHLAPSMSTWQYLSARADAISSSSSSSSSSLSAVSPAAVPADVSMRNVDIAAMLRQYATLHECVRSFCEDVLEKDTELAEAHDIVDAESPVKDIADSSGDRKCHSQNVVETCVETSVPNAVGMETANGPIANRTEVSSTEKQQDTKSSVEGNCSEDTSSMQLNADLSDSVLPLRSTDCESREPNSGEPLTDGNTKTGNFSASNGNRNPEIGNLNEPSDNLHTVREIKSEWSETESVLTCAVEKSDNSELLKSDCCKMSYSTSSENSADQKAFEADKASSVEPALELHNEDSVVHLTADNSQSVSDELTGCSAGTSETAHTGVTVRDNTSAADTSDTTVTVRDNTLAADTSDTTVTVVDNVLQVSITSKHHVNS